MHWKGHMSRRHCSPFTDAGFFTDGTHTNTGRPIFHTRFGSSYSVSPGAYKAREVDSQQVFFCSNDAVSSLSRLEQPYSLLLSSLTPLPALFSLDESSKYKYLSSRRLYKVQAKISGHAIHDKTELWKLELMLVVLTYPDISNKLLVQIRRYAEVNLRPSVRRVRSLWPPFAPRGSSRYGGTRFFRFRPPEI